MSLYERARGKLLLLVTLGASHCGGREQAPPLPQWQPEQRREPMLRTSAPQTCRLIRLESNGQPVLEISGQELPVLIHGLEIPQLVPELYRDIMTQRINWIESSLLYVAVEPSRQPPSLRISYLAAKDKSGDIWLDLATLLVEEGAARVARGTFTERDALLAAEARARARGLGIWAEGE